jgi:hypothetical protein
MAYYLVLIYLIAKTEVSKPMWATIGAMNDYGDFKIEFHTSHQTRPKIDTGDASLLMGSIS